MPVTSVALHGRLAGSSGFLPSLVCLLKPTSAKGKCVKARLVVDSAAANSFIRAAVLQSFEGFPSVSRQENVHGIGGSVTKTQVSYINCEILSLTKNFNLSCSLRAIDRICAPLPSLEIEWADFPEVNLLEVTEELPRPPVEVDVLLGNDHLARILNGVKGIGSGKRYLLWDTQLGVALSGNDASENSRNISANSQLLISNEQLYSELKQFWNWESLGIAKDQVILSPKEKYVVEHFHANVLYKNNRYQVSLPFDPDKPKPRNNYGSALAQFKSLERTLCRNESKKERYVKALTQYISDGHAELVFSANPDKDDRYFLPHHAIWRDNHPSTPARIVFNGSAPDDTGYSLNDALLPGPKLQSDLCDIVTRYRTYEYTLSGDIRKMFLMIVIERTQRDFLSFLWRDPGSNQPIQVYRKKVLPFGLNCAPYVAIQTVAHHIENFGSQYPAAAQLIKQQIFVDDVLVGAKSVQELMKIRLQIMELMAKGGFHVTKWLANNSEVMAAVPDEDRAAAAPRVLAEKIMTLSVEPVSKTLGIMWNPLSDNFEFQGALALMVPLAKETMRTLSSRAAKIFDPLGFVAPVTIAAKICMQACFKAKMKWDDPLPSNIATPWNEWVKQVHYLHFLDVPRHLYVKNPVHIELHVFSDASELAAAAAVYARSVDAKGKVQVTLVAAKTKLAPIQTASIPRLELMGALLGAQLGHKVQKCLNVKQVTLWTDNTTTLQWIQQSPCNSWKTFVANRVSQITELFDPALFRHVGTYENPADLATRGMAASSLLKCAEWFEGPAFLALPEDFWPRTPIPSKETPEVLEEKKAPEVSCLITVKQQSIMEEIFGPIRPFAASIRLLALVIRFGRNSQPKYRASRDHSNHPSLRERKNAMKIWARWIQSSSFPAELKLLRAGEVVPKGQMRQLQPFYDASAHLAKVGGRLQFSGLPEETIHPVILPAKNVYVERYVMQLHLAMSHMAAEGLLCHIRMRFWLLQGRREVKRILRKCIKCYRLRAPAFQQVIAPFPKARVANQCAFVDIALDYAGPFFVLKEKIFRTDEEEFAKVWILLATCLASRAVHLEYMVKMDADHLINAIQRMIARRGHCRLIYSDNAKQFVKCDKQLQKLYLELDWAKVERHLIKLPTQIEFRFSPPIAPHWGGVWERMVRSVKIALKSTLGNRRATFEVFRTVLCNAEAVVNSRPLTLVSDDAGDPLPISPAHLLLGRAIMQIPDFLGRDDRRDKIAVQWKERQRLHTEFWGRFRKEYLLALQPSNKWTVPDFEPREGEVVLMEDPPKTRNEWPLARIQQVYRGRDGLVRSVLLFFNSGTEPLRRDIRRIFQLEERDSDRQLTNDGDPGHVSQQTDDGGDVASTQ